MSTPAKSTPPASTPVDDSRTIYLNCSVEDLIAEAQRQEAEAAEFMAPYMDIEDADEMFAAMAADHPEMGAMLGMLGVKPA